MNRPTINLRRIIDAVDYIKECVDAGGDRQRAFDLTVDFSDMQQIADTLDAFRERIENELESAENVGKEA